jgi:predicted ATPase/transcriptional regulator with GAF, ATPase, and Fis domain
MELPGYTIEESVHRGRKRVVYRGRRERDRASVIIKTLAADFPAPADVAGLGREYEILRDLDVLGVPRACGLERHRDRPALILEDAPGVRLKTQIAGRRLELPVFLAYAIQLVDVLAALHRHGIVHKDVNPNNILVDPAVGRLTLIDFSIASRLPSEHPQLVHPNLLEGTIAYMSPEQTGRMNREVDYRTDFYSLGVTFYEMLTGRLPFESDDPLEVVHAHIAKTPPSPADRDPAIPRPVSDIVMRLLAKTAEQRYQSVVALRADLTACLDEWRATGDVARAVVGANDVSDRFVVPQQLYGREAEVGVLLEAFARVCEGETRLLMVSGYSGIGKTTLIRELYKPLLGRRGCFLAGKFDQLVPVPYGAFLQAFRGLVQQLLTEGEAQLEAWRARLAEALGSGASVVAEVIPEIELVLGKQPPAPPLGPAEAQNRFRLVFQNLVGALAGREHPLVVFLDDLQWADTATLNLLEPLLSSPAVESLFLIGAYRDNEVGAAHPLVHAVDGLEAAGVRLQRLSLGPLGLDHLTRLVRDALHGDLAEAEPLARLIAEKTGGNPFFVIQFLKALREAGLLVFDEERRRWAFRMEAIAGAGMTDNVIDLMTRKIRRLSPRAQSALTLAACIGNRFDLETLAVVSRQSREHTAEDLTEALVEGLLLPADRAREAASGDGSVPAAGTASAFAFLHDRVQQAAYALIPAERKHDVHLAVGRLLLEGWDASSAEERVFDVVHHLNLASDLITEDAERLELARLNLAAARKAKSSTAYQAAESYAGAGLALLEEEHWQSDYELLFELSLEAAECRYLCADFDEAERRFEALLARARSRLDRARVCILMTLQYESRSRYADAIRAGRQGLALFGLTYPDDPADRQQALEAQLAAVRRLQGDRPIAALADLPIMEDPESRAVMKLLTNLHTPCYLSADKTLTLLNTTAMVRLSLERGNTDESAYAYVLHAMHVGSILGDHGSAYAFGRLALAVNDRFPHPGLRARVLMNFAWNVSLWRRPMEESIPIGREAFQLGNDNGLFVEAAYALFNDCWFALLTGRDLEAVRRTCASNIDYIRRIQMHRFTAAPQVIAQWGLALQGRTVHPSSLTGGDFDEDVFRRTYGGQGLFEMFFHVARVALLYTFGSPRAACEVARDAERVIRDYTGTIWDELRVFYHALALAAVHPDLAPAERRAAEDELEALSARLGAWAESSTHNFGAQHLVVRAEIARVGGLDGEAERLYQAAVEAAEGRDCPRERALANELAARFWRGRDISLARRLMAEARYAYAQWGAEAKVADLDERYPDLLGRSPDERLRTDEAPGYLASPQVTAEGPAGLLEVAAVIRAAQAIAGEIELERLLDSLLRIVLENAGAERCLLILDQDGGWFVRAEGTVDRIALKEPGAAALEETHDLPASVVHYVTRTSESVVLSEARRDDRYCQDPYIVSRGPRSILCVPVINQGRLMGVLYLENSLVPGAFTLERIQLTQILAAQAAIAIQNAALFAEVTQLRDRLQAENVYLLEEVKTQHRFEEIVGRSPALREVLGQIERVAPTHATVLIQGETGTGKELVARALHDLSRRKERPLVVVNCGAISPGLVESELFGHEKGAFTGAVARKIGRFELADGGTIFLDEIGDLSMDLQVKLLRVLQEGEMERVGGTRPLRVDVRVIAATNHDLAQAVGAGRFRADLYYRLNVFPIRTPPLRERREDIPLLVRYFVLKYAVKLGKRIETVPRSTLEALAAYSWPGNVRELANVIERSVILSTGTRLELGDWITSQRPGLPDSPEGTLEAVERDHIARALAQTGWKVSGPHGAARLLGLKPTTLEARMKKLGIKRPRSNAPNIS